MKRIANILNKIKENAGLTAGMLILGLLFGWLIFHSSSTSAAGELHDHDHEEDVKATIYTCSMHPQIKQDHPGTCPICAMDLVPLNSLSSGNDIDADAIVMTESAAALAEILTAKVTSGKAEHQLYLQGTVSADERKTAAISARYGGRIEKLYVNFTGQMVHKGDKLAEIYSPDLIAAQQELFEARSLQDSQEGIYQAAKFKLKQWNLSDQQIDAIEEAGEPLETLDIVAPISGTVTERHISEGDYVKEGTSLFELSDFKQVWVLFDAYEKDLAWIRKGDMIAVSSSSNPAISFEAPVKFIDPVVDQATRVARVRIETDNKRELLRPGMFVQGKVDVSLGKNKKGLLIPASAILWTGKRSIVYVKDQEAENPTFQLREIKLGIKAGNEYMVEEGLKEGEEIAVNGVFKIDAAAQLEGKASMMNPSGEKMNMTHDHGKEMNNQIELESSSFRVGGECGMCKDRIEETALAIEGIRNADWNEDTKILKLDYTGATDLKKVHKAIAAVGHDTELEKAPDEVYEALPACCLYERFTYQENEGKIVNEDIPVAGNCGMCKKRIQDAALALEGVSFAEWSAEEQALKISYDASKTSNADIQKAVAQVGHDTEKYKAPDDVYENLPACCLYERW